MKTIIRCLIATLICCVAVYVASLFLTADSVTWYQEIRPYVWSLPPGALVTVVFLLALITGIAVGLIWSKESFWDPWVAAFTITLMFVTASFIFLVAYQVALIAVFLAVCVFAFVIPLFMHVWEEKPLAAYALIPYMLWVAYTLYFTAAVWLS
ncbi:hypothetical protein C4568_00910 [Candidatus Parcubacteria bacterium]|nr:MAG: hypothetical protein C4568_00910 [Candidatus Parcubacteria bacterium]